MLDLIGRGTSHTCNVLRDATFCKLAHSGHLGAALQMLQAESAGIVDPSKDKKSCILIFNWGAPSQLDTFDMKPNAPADVDRSNRYRPAPTGFNCRSRHAKIADKIAWFAPCFHRGAAVHDSGCRSCKPDDCLQAGSTHRMLAQPYGIYEARAVTCLPISSCLRPWDAAEAISPEFRQAGGFLGKAYDPF